MARLTELCRSGWCGAVSAARTSAGAVRGFVGRLAPVNVSLAGGADYHMSSAFVLLLLLIFLIFGFPWIRADLATSSCATNDFSSQLASSQFDIGMVLSLLLVMLVMVADRVIYRLWAPPSADVDDAADAIADAPPATAPPATAPPDAPGPLPAAPPAAWTPAADAFAAALNPNAPPPPAAEPATAPPRPLLHLPLPALKSRVVRGKSPRLAPALKLVLHGVLTLLLHLCFCLGLGPNGTSVLPVWACDRVVCDGTPAPPGEPVCARSAAGITLYLLCAAYLLLSAMQLKRGLPLIPTEHPLTGSPGMGRYYLHVVGMSFPFLWEMRTALDWTVTPTSLSLFEWFKLEDIYSGLVSVRAAMAEKQAYPLGGQRPVWTKLSAGALFVALVLVLILGPMFFFSSANPIAQSNLVKSATLHLTVRTPSGSFPLGSISRFNNDLDQPLPPNAPVIASDCSAKQLQEKDNRGCGYAYLLPLEANVDYQRLVFAKASNLVWAINPQTLQDLSSTLARKELQVGIEVTVEWTREQPVGGATVSSLSKTVTLSDEQREQMLLATNASRPAGTVGIDVSALYPKFVRLPAVSGQPPRALGDSALMAWHTTQDMSVVLHASPVGPLNPRGTEWWAVRQTSNDTSPFGARQGEGLRLIIIADRLAGGSAGSTLFAGGVVAFYSAVVLAIARLLRGSLGGTRYRLVTDEMPHTRDLFDLCEAVAIARRDGSLLREAQLFQTILRLYRSPETLLRLTGGALKRD